MSSTSIRGIGVSYNPLFIAAPNYVNAATMSTVGQTIVIPVGVTRLRFAANLDYWLQWGSTGVSTVASSAGAASEFIPYLGGPIYRTITTQGTTAIAVLSTAAATISQTWWSN
jgi:hypothetical protein